MMPLFKDRKLLGVSSTVTRWTIVDEWLRPGFEYCRAT